MKTRIAIAMLCSFIMGCSSQHRVATTQPVGPAEPMSLSEALELVDNRAAWTDFPSIDVPRHPTEKYLKDLTIVIDPGHGGTNGGRYATRPSNRGPTGVREADMNLRVGLLLERLLKDAGVNVIMTRTGDDTIDLKERAEVANNAKRLDGGIGADLFISIHHNTGGGNKDANYTTVWYHGQVDEAEPDLDAARHVAHWIGDLLHTQWTKTSPLLSDQLMYPNGFGVLNSCNVPAFLCEASFYSNAAEEQRLRDSGYNLREAYAMYRGLCEWAYQGRPTQSSPIITTQGSEIVAAIELNDGLPVEWWGHERNRIIRSTIKVTLDDQPIDFKFDEKTKLLTATLPQPSATQPSTKPSQRILGVHHANMFKHHNWPQRYQLSFAVPESGGAPTIRVDTLGAVRSPSTQPTTRATTRTATTSKADASNTSK